MKLVPSVLAGACWLLPACASRAPLPADGAGPVPPSPEAGPPWSGGAGGAGDAFSAGLDAHAGSGGSEGNPTDAAVDARAPDGSAAVDAGPAHPRCPPGPFPPPVVGAVTTVCADAKLGYNYNEGPTWVAGQGAFFFSNYEHYVGHGGDIVKYTPGGSCEVYIAGVGCNGLAVTADGNNLVGACHQTRSVMRFDLGTKQGTTVADSYMGQMLNTPNDLVVHSNGTIYFTDPPFELGGRPPGVSVPIFRVDPAGMVTAVAPPGRYANGIGLSPDEKRLYALQGGIWDLDAAGVPANQRPLFVGGDGMAVDCAGNLYASGAIYSAQGQRLGSYPVSTNLAFGGADGKTLLLVGPGTRVRTVAMNVPGLP